MKSKLIYVAAFLLLILIMLPCNETFAQSQSGYHYLDYFDCYNSEVEKKYLSDTYNIYVSEDETYEYIKIDVDSYGEYDKKILDDSIIYKFTEVSGKSVQSFETGLKGKHFDKVTLAKTSSGLLQIVVYLNKNVFYSFEGENRLDLKIKYTNSYQKYLDNKLEEKKEYYSEKDEEVVLSDDFYKELDYFFNGPILYAEYDIDEHIASFKIPGLKLTSSNGAKLYETSYNSRTKKLFVHFDKNLGNINIEQLKINDYIIKKISISSNIIKKDTTTIVIESDEKLYFSQNNNYKKGFELLLSTRPIPDEDEIEEIKEPIVEEENNDEEFKEETNSHISEAKHIADLTFNLIEKYNEDEFVIDLVDIESFNVSRMSEPERIVIDLHGIFLQKHLEEIDKNTDYVKSIRYARYNEQTARLVIDLKNPEGYSDTYSPQNNYRYEVKEGKLHVYISDRLFDKYFYSNVNDRVYLLLMGDYLTSSEVYPLTSKMYTSSYNKSSNIYTITYDSNYGYNGKMEINDNYIEYIEAYSNNKKTTLEIKLKDSTVEPLPLTRYMKTRDGHKYYHSTITFVKKKAPGEKIIVIDAGHGGADPGTTAASYMGDSMLEKNVNLDMARRLERMLEERGYKVYMTREDDSYVGLGERANVANMMGADLFLSIHNNAYYKSFHGTETFHFPYPESDPGIDCVEFANLLQNELIDELKLFNRGVKKAEFSVLKYTDMPSCLVEIGFLSNPDEAKLISQASFRERTARALYKAVAEALSRIK